MTALAPIDRARADLHARTDDGVGADAGIRPDGRAVRRRRTPGSSLADGAIRASGVDFGLARLDLAQPDQAFGGHGRKLRADAAVSMTDRPGANGFAASARAR